MTATRSRKSRGYASQRLVAAALQWLFPRAEAVAAALPGADVRFTPGASFEVKARRSFDPAAWMRQARKQAGEDELAVVVMRPDGAGEKSVLDWPAFVRLEDLMKLLAGAGYGEREQATVGPPEAQHPPNL